MLEMLINPKKAERRPWELFFVGAVYAAVSFALVNWVFAKDNVLSNYSGILLVIFTVMFSMPFVYYTIKFEESKITPHKGVLRLLKEHEKAISAFMWLFLGIVFSFSIMYVLFSSANIFKPQIETYCMINRPTSFDSCLESYGIDNSSLINGYATSKERFFLIFSNNIYVLIFTLVFSLVFGAGVIFILAWNASVIAAAIGIFSNSNISSLPMGFFRFMIHGIPEIASYFIVALAGGMVSVAVIKHEIGTEKFWEVLQDSLNLIILSVIVLFVAAIIEVYVTPIFF